tara:strand:+ start:1358 stop:1570 length:213 start_codon:yes stop_codon:yes gene_type:complete
MNRYILHLITILAFVPLIIFASAIFIILLPIIFSGMAYNSFHLNRMNEFYIFIVLNFLSIFLALNLLGVF